MVQIAIKQQIAFSTGAGMLEREREREVVANCGHITI